MAFQIIRNDITRVQADAIVNTANPEPIYAGGTDYAIYQAAGVEELLAARKKIGAIAGGDAAVTPAFALPAKIIIHTVGPLWEGGNQGEYEILRSCYRKCLQLALAHNCRSIAFPLIATGVYGFPKEKALEIATSEIQAFLLEHDMQVILVVFDKKAYVLSGRLVEHVAAYIDANFVDSARKWEYAIDECLAMPSVSATDRWESEERVERAERAARSPRSPRREENLPRVSKQAFGWELPKLSKKKQIEELLGKKELTFQQKLFRYIDERGLSGPQVYKGYISKQVYSKIQNDENYHPNKYTALALCLSLHLDVEQTLDLIGRAGFTLSPASKADLIVKACILAGEYNVVNIDLLLFDYDCPQLENIK